MNTHNFTKVRHCWLDHVFRIPHRSNKYKYDYISCGADRDRNIREGKNCNDHYNAHIAYSIEDGLKNKPIQLKSFVYSDKDFAHSDLVSWGGSIMHFLRLLCIVLSFSLLSGYALENTASAFVENVDFPELFKYDNQKNTNLETALLSISSSFNDNSVSVTQELLAAIMATLDKEVGEEYLPIEEEGDYGMGSGCTYKVGGSCRSTPYDGGLDYKGRGYIQITHKYNYQKYCPDCVGTSTPELDICGCKNQWYCTVTDLAVCPQVKALQPEYAAKIFASYYIENNLVSLSNSESYWNVGKIINGGDAYASDFNAKANAYITLFSNNPNKTNSLLAWLNSGATTTKPKKVTLNLFVHDGSTSGPIIPSAQVLVQDSSGNSFQQTTDSSGYTTVKGDSGTWSFTVSSDNHVTETWNQDITEDCTKHAFLQKEQQQASTSPATVIIFVHDGSELGPIIPNAQVTAKDGSGNLFQQSVNVSDYVTFTGCPGTWNIEVSANNYSTISRDWEITRYRVEHLFLWPKYGDHICETTAPLETWVKTFGGTYDQEAYSVHQTIDGGYIITGYNEPGPHPIAVWLIKTDENGNMVWNKSFTGKGNAIGYSVQQTSDGGYIIAGETDFGAWLIKTDENGNMVWDRIIGQGEAHSVQQTIDGGYIIGGTTKSYCAGGMDIWLIKTNENGDEIWNKTYGTEDHEEGYSVRQTNDGGYIISGQSIHSKNKELCLIKTDANGNEIWKILGGGNSVQQTTDGGYIFGGDWLTKTDQQGNRIWRLRNTCLSVSQTTDGGYVATNKDSTVRTDELGKTLWEKPIGGYSIQQTNDGGYIIAGSKMNGEIGRTTWFDYDVRLIKIDPD